MNNYLSWQTTPLIRYKINEMEKESVVLLNDKIS